AAISAALSIDGSPVPLGSTAINEPIGISISPWGRWKSLDNHRDVITSLWIKKHSNTNKLISMTINDHRGTSGYDTFYKSSFPP
ncbi:MAG: hypothetical protein ACO2O0_06400, partial [Desulfurococcales archaeon]